MRTIDKHIQALEKSFDSNQSEFSHLSDEELEEFIIAESEAFGYRPAKPGEVVEVPEIDRNLLLAEVTSLTDEELDEVVKYGLAEDGYIPVSEEQGMN